MTSICNIYFIFLLLILSKNLYAQNSYLGSYDPHSKTTGLPYADRGLEVMEYDSNLFVVSGYVDVVNNYNRVCNMMKFDLSTYEFTSQIDVISPQGDMAIVGGIISIDGGIYLAGEWVNFEQERKKMSLAKYNTDLELEWITYFNDLDNPNLSFFCYDICSAHNGDLLMPIIVQDASNSDLTALWILRVDLNGNVIYFRQLPTILPAVTSGGNLTNSLDGTYMLTSPATGWNGDFRYSYLQVHRLDEDANVIWTDAHLGEIGYWQVPYSSTDAFGNTTVIWTQDSTFIYLDSTIVTAFTKLINLNPDGEIRWEYPWVRIVRTSYLSDLHPAENGDILGSGIWDDVEDTQFIHGWAFRMNQEGELLWSRQYADTTTQFLYDRSWQPFYIFQMTEMEDKRIAMTGWRLEYTDIPQPGSVNANVLLMITDSLGCLTPGCSDDVQYLTSAKNLISINKVPIRQLDIMPNPASKDLYIQRLDLPNNTQKSNLRLDAFDMSGKKIWGNIWNGEELQINISSWPTGKIVLHCSSNGLPLATGSIIKINE